MTELSSFYQPSIPQPKEPLICFKPWSKQTDAEPTTATKSQVAPDPKELTENQPQQLKPKSRPKKTGSEPTTATKSQVAPHPKELTENQPQQLN